MKLQIVFAFFAIFATLAYAVPVPDEAEPAPVTEAAAPEPEPTSEPLAKSVDEVPEESEDKIRAKKSEEPAVEQTTDAVAPVAEPKSVAVADEEEIRVPVEVRKDDELLREKKSEEAPQPPKEEKVDEPAPEAPRASRDAEEATTISNSSSSEEESQTTQSKSDESNSEESKEEKKD